MPIQFRRERLAAHFSSPDGLQELERHVEVRFDPLLGTSARVAQGVTLAKADPAALAPIQALDPSCPFCAPRIEQVTPLIPATVCAERQIRVGATVLFPNLAAHSQYAAVSVFSLRHWLSLREFTPRLLEDNLIAAARYVRAVHHADPQAEHYAYNVDYLYPSGCSLPHPHAQVYLDPYPTTMLRLQREAGDRYCSEHGRSFWEDLVEAEENGRERFIGRIGTTSWMAAFAPLGFNEVRAVVSGRATALELGDEDLRSLAVGISRVLSWYEVSGYNSFNLALYSGPLGGSPSFRVNLAMLTRSALAPYYRSDAMYLERLHWEAAVDCPPETVATELRPRFAT